jgi:hypothetical protein
MEHNEPLIGAAEAALDKELREWLLIRKKAAAEITPRDVRFTWEYGSIRDPYGIFPPFEEDNTGRIYFAFAPLNKVWVSFYDLPGPIVSEIWKKIDSGEVTEDKDHRYTPDPC